MAKLKVKKMKDSVANQVKLGLFLKTTLVGFLLAIPAASQTLHINDLNLTKQYQGLGYDSVLLEAAQNAAVESGLSRISLDIIPADFGLYKEQGFLKEGVSYLKDGIELQKVSKVV